MFRAEERFERKVHIPVRVEEVVGCLCKPEEAEDDVMTRRGEYRGNNVAFLVSYGECNEPQW